MSRKEVELKKGNMSEVVKNGNTVLRDLKPQSQTIQRLLQHLEKKGIHFVPCFLGLTDNNQEMLSFVEGETIEDYPTTTDIQQRIITIQTAAKMLRAYHDATLDFERCLDDIWFLTYEGELAKEVICHNDFAPYNVTFIDNKPVGLIDFDTACPAPRIWDVAYAVYRFVPLSSKVYDPVLNQYRDFHQALDGAERKLLFHTFIEAYGFHDASDVLDHVVLRLQALNKLFDEECHKGNPAFLKMKAEGHQKFYQNEIEFIKMNKRDWI